jgi:predicted membrane protein
MKKELYFMVMLFLAIIFLSLTLSAIVAVINLDFIEENIFSIIITLMGLFVSGFFGCAFTKKLMDLIEEDKKTEFVEKDNEKWN